MYNIYSGLRSLCITGVGLRSLVNMSRPIPGWSQLPNRVHYLGLGIKTAQERRIGSVRKKKLTSRRFFFHRGDRDSATSAVAVAADDSSPPYSLWIFGFPYRLSPLAWWAATCH